MRASCCFALRDQNRPVHQANQEFVASLPPELRGPMRRRFDRAQTGLKDSLDMFRSLHAAHNGKRRVKVQLALAKVLGPGAGGAFGPFGHRRRADAHAPRRDRLSEGVCAAPGGRRHGIGVPGPLRDARPAPDARPWRLAERARHRAGAPPGSARASRAAPRWWRRSRSPELVIRQRISGAACADAGAAKASVGIAEPAAMRWRPGCADTLGNPRASPMPQPQRKPIELAGGVRASSLRCSHRGNLLPKFGAYR